MSDDVLSWLPAVRKAGLFADYPSLSDVELLALLEQQRRQEYEQLFDEEDLQPEPIGDEIELLALDHQRVVALNLEAEVSEENQVYTEVLHLFAIASGGQFNPTNIREKWQTVEGPITVTFTHQGREVSFQPEYDEEWISEEVFTAVSDEMQRTGPARFMVYLGKDGEGFGELAVFVLLLPEEQQVLEKELGWKFAEE